jgi:hypothetical protein
MSVNSTPLVKVRISYSNPSNIRIDSGHNILIDHPHHEGVRDPVQILLGLYIGRGTTAEANVWSTTIVRHAGVEEFRGIEESRFLLWPEQGYCYIL